MSRIDADQRDLALSLAVYGAPKAGKTTILHCIQDRVSPAHRGGIEPFGTAAAVAPLLDWLPLELGQIGGWRTRVNLYAIPDQRHADATRRLILGDVDGVLFAADAQAERLAANVGALANLRENLDDHDGRPRDVPIVMLYTKDDLPAELRLERSALNGELNPDGHPDFPCSALRGEGVLEALHCIIAAAMRRHAPGPAGSS